MEGKPIWPKNDIKKLIEKIEDQIPPKDNLHFKSRLDKLDWDKVAFGSYSSQKCKEMWGEVQKYIRGYRLLKEILTDAKDWTENPKQAQFKQKKKYRHPDLPRKPLSSYMIFYLENKNKWLKKHPQLDLMSLSKMAGEKFKNLPQHKKDKYNQMFLERKKQYEEAMKKFYEEHPDQIPKKSNKKSRKSQDNFAPKRPFKLFYDNRKEEEPDLDKNKIYEEWKNLDDSDKTTWIQLAIEMEEKTKKNLKNYISENPNYVPTNSNVSLLTKSEISLLDKLHGKPDKPPSSGYALFSKEVLSREEIQDLNARDRIYAIAQMWKNIPANEKQKYAEEIERLKKQYEEDYKKYIDSLPEEKRLEELAKLNKPSKRKGNENHMDFLPEKIIKKEQSFESPETSQEIKMDFNEPFKLPPQAPLYQNEPEPPPKNEFVLFVKKMLKSKQYTLSQLQSLWKNLTVADKAKYRQKLTELKKSYVASYRNFLESFDENGLKKYRQWKKEHPCTNNDDMLNPPKESDSSSSDSGSSSSSSSEENDSSDED